MSDAPSPTSGPIGRLKRLVLEQLLREEDFVLVVVDPASPGVKLPTPLLEGGQPVALHLGLRMAVPVPDLLVDETGISGTLSFNRAPFHVSLPWPSLVQVSVRDEHLIWLTPSAPGLEPRAPGSKDRPRLRLV